MKISTNPQPISESNEAAKENGNTFNNNIGSESLTLDIKD
jgi:hypothetical protein